MTDAEFLEKVRGDMHLTQQEMSELLGFNSVQAYHKYAYKKSPFKSAVIKKFMEKLRLKKWNEYVVVDDYALLTALYDRVIKLEQELTGRKKSEIKKEIEEERAEISRMACKSRPLK